MKHAYAKGLSLSSALKEDRAVEQESGEGPTGITVLEKNRTA